MRIRRGLLRPEQQELQVPGSSIPGTPSPRPLLVRSPEQQQFQMPGAWLPAGTMARPLLVKEGHTAQAWFPSMDVRGVVVRPEQQEFKMPGAWLPGTMARPLLVKESHTASADCQVNRVGGTSWVDSVVGLAPGVVCSTRAVQESACQKGGSGSTAVASRVMDLGCCGAASQSFVSARSPYPRIRAVSSYTQGWHQVRYSGHIEMAANAGAPSSMGTSPPTSIFGNITSGRGQSSTPLLLRGKAVLNTRFLKGVQPLPAACATVAPPFAGIAYPVGGGETAREGQEQARCPRTFEPKGMDPIQLHFGQGVSERACLSSVGNEIQGSAQKQGVDLNMTPPEKPRKRGYVPNVVQEWEPARTPEPASPKPANYRQQRTGETSSGKRKYVQMDGLYSNLETNELHVKGTRPVRRCLDFPGEDGNATCQSTRDGTNSTVVQNEGQEVDVNSFARKAPSLSYLQNQILDGNLNMPGTPSLLLQPSRRELIRENLKQLARIRDSRQVPRHESTAPSEIQARCPMTPENLPTRSSASNLLLRDDSMGRDERDMENDLLTNDDRFLKVDVVQADFKYEQTCNSSRGIALTPSHSNYQFLDGYLNSLETPSLLLQPSRRELIQENLKKLSRIGDSRQVPSHVSITQSEIQTGCQMTPENSSNRSSALNLLSRDESMGRGESNMVNDLVTNDARLSNGNMVRVDFNYKQTCNSSAGITPPMSHSRNQIPDGYLSSLEIPSLPLQPSRRELIRENLKNLASLRDSRQVPSHESTAPSEIQIDVK